MSVSARQQSQVVDPQLELERRVDVGQRLDHVVVGRAGALAEAEALALAQQLLARWRRIGGEPWRCDGVKIRVGDAPIGEAGVDLDGRFFLAGAAGLLAVQPEPTATAAELLAFIDALAQLEPTAAALRALRRRLASGAFTGVIAALGAPAWSTARRAGVGVAPRAGTDARRSAGVGRLLQLVEGERGRAGGGPDDGGGEPQPIDRGEARALRLGADAAAFWLPVEVACLDGDEARRTAIGAATHAGWVARAARDGATLGLGPALTALRRAGGAHGAALERALPTRALAREVGRRVRLDAQALADIEVQLQAGDAWAGGLASGLLERGRGDERSLQALQAILSRFGLERLWELASLEGIDEASARSLAWALRQADAAPQLWADLVGVAPPKVAAWILSSAPLTLLQRFGPPLRRALRDRGAEDSAPLIEALLRTDSADAVRVVAEALIEGRGQGWSGRLVPEVLQAAVRHGLGRPLLVPLFLDREVDVKLRSAVLRALQGDPAALEEAVRFRVTEMLEPRELQERIKAARKGGKGDR